MATKAKAGHACQIVTNVNPDAIKRLFQILVIFFVSNRMEKKSRITSYNVCYTKLLREKQTISYLVNGKLENTTPISKAVESCSGNLLIGCTKELAASTRKWLGQIDELYIYKRALRNNFV